MSRCTAPSGLLLLHKRAGLTSFEALADVKRALETGKVGHTGTLDKFAEGLLLVLTGRALKLSRWFSHCDKQYEGVIRFGVETDTLDPEGAVIAEAALPGRDAVEQVLPQFTGEIMQAPPVYSAIHIDGRRASALARAGAPPQMQKRPVTIHHLELLSWEPPFARIFVHCSSGAYIRSLARDIACASGSRAHLASLVRTRVAGFSLEEAVDLDNGPSAPVSPHDRLRPIGKPVFEALGFPWIEVTPGDAQKILHGKPLSPLLDGKNTAKPLGIFRGEEFIALAEYSGGKWGYGCVYA